MYTVDTCQERHRLIQCGTVITKRSQVLTKNTPQWSVRAWYRPLFTKRTHVLPEDLVKSRSLDFSKRSEIWQETRQQHCRDSCQIREQYDLYTFQSRGFETAIYLSLRRLTAYWIEAIWVICEFTLWCVFCTCMVCAVCKSSQCFLPYLKNKRLSWSRSVFNGFIQFYLAHGGLVNSLQRGLA